VGDLCGGRDVHVNLRVVTEEARALGVHNHVCEVQLVLQAVSVMKVPSERERGGGGGGGGRGEEVGWLAPGGGGGAAQEGREGWSERGVRGETAGEV
jgi:hypothetical protein